jgi:NAD dependent epimerase/dehydratase family enzyme
MPAPAIALRLLFGQMAEEVLLAGQRVVPKRLDAVGFAFGAPAIETALAEELGRG